MSIFGTILSKIFHGTEAQAAPAPQPAGTAAGSSAAPTPAPTGQTSPSASTATAPAPTPSNENTATSAPAAPAQSVDVGAVLDGLAAKSSQKLDWKHSIVDMMKLLDMDSSLGARKTLAQELHYSGDTDDSAGMNIWLHKAVMQKLADNGGTLPADLKS